MKLAAHGHTEGFGVALSMDRLVTMERAVRTIAARYHRNAARLLAREDLESAAWLELVRSVRGYDETLGVEFSTYCYRIVINACRKELLWASAPVTTSCRSVDQVRGLQRAELAHAEGREDPAQRPDAQYDDAEFRHRVRTQVEALVGEQGAPFAFAVVTKEYTPAEIAAYHGVPVTEVYKLSHKVRSILSNDRELYELWQQKVK